MADPETWFRHRESVETKPMEMYIHDGASAFRFVLLGALEASAARELDRAWRTAASLGQGRGVLVDVTGLTGIDDDGLRVLAQMRESGCKLEARQMPPTPRVAHLIEVTAPGKKHSSRAGRWIASLSQRWLLALAVVLTLFLVGADASARHGLRRDTGELHQPERLSGQVITRAAKSVCLIQGAYVFRDMGSGKLLRRNGWMLDGDASVIENSFSGTGFLVSSDGGIVTNRHVAQPWTVDRDAQQIVAAGYRPELTRLKAYFPGRDHWYNLKPARISATVDVALLQAGESGSFPAPLILDYQGQAAPGDRIVLIGFPGGLGPILDRGGQSGLGNAPGSLDLTDDQVAQALAAEDLLEAFVSVGYVSNVSGSALTLAAAASDGSSGSPVLNEHGAVIGILSASMTRVDGASLAVPVRGARALLHPRRGG